jgi:quinol-cytochrome oxidoreductase complex cytochrome b subunit
MPREPLTTRSTAWLRQRMPLAAIEGFLAHKTVPRHDQTVWYFLGGMLILSLALLILTGMLLTFYYQPYVPEDPAGIGAHESVRQIVTDVPHGWWIRSIHHWSAHLMIIALLAHLFSTLLLKAYRKPREFIWWSGLVLLVLALASAFTGYLLPWNSLSFAATRVGAGIVGRVPLAGRIMRQMLLGGLDVSALTLTRFYGLHVAVLPLVILLTMAIHVLLVLQHGSSTPPSVERRINAGARPSTVRFWPSFVRRELRLAVLVTAGILVVAFAVPPSLGTRADPLAPTPTGIKPEWYFLAFFRALKLLPTRIAGVENIKLAVLGSAFLAVVIIALPALDVAPDTTRARRRRARFGAWGLLLSSMALTWVALLAPVAELIRRFWPAHGWIAPEAAHRCAPLATAALLLVVTVLLRHATHRRSHAPATVFGLVLLLTYTGYTLWEAFGGAVAAASTAALAVVLLAIGVLRARRADGRSRSAGLLAAALLLASLLSVMPLGKAHEFVSHAGQATSQTATADGAGVPDARRTESASRLAACLVVLAFLLVVVDRQVRDESRLRELGVTD